MCICVCVCEACLLTELRYVLLCGGLCISPTGWWNVGCV